MIPLGRDIVATLTVCARHLQPARDPWWVIGSTAVALHRIDPGPVSDIDILVSVPDAERFAREWRCPDVSDTGSDLFRSAVLLNPEFGNFPVEIMAGLEFRQFREWQQVAPETRQKIRLGGIDLFVPERPELIEILRSFGRKKDIRRADLMCL